MAEYRDEYIADVTQYVRNVERAADAADKFGDQQSQAALAARRMALAADDAGDTAARAQRKAAEEARRYEHAAKEAADAAQALARGESDTAVAAKAVERAQKAQERSAQAATRAIRQMERAEIAQAVAAKAAAKAIDDQADQMRQLARSGAFKSVAKAGISAASSLAQKWTDASLLIKAGIVALPLAAAAAAFAIPLAIGGAMATVGIVVAAHNEKVKASFTAMADHIKAKSRGMARPMEAELKHAAVVGAQVFDSLQPHLAQAMKAMAPEIRRFVDQFGNILKGMGPFLDHMTERFKVVFGTFTGRLPDLINHLTGALSKMADAASPEAINLLVDAIDGAVMATAKLVSVLGQAATGLGILWENISKGAITIRNFAVATTVGDDRVAQFQRHLTGTTDSMDGFGDSAKRAAEKVKEWHSAVLASYNSQIGLEQAIDDASKAIKDNGKTLDINTQKGRDNKTALLAIGAAALRAAEDAKKSGADSSSAMTRGYNAFVKAARGAGMTKEAARALARQIGLIPSHKDVTFRTNAAAATRSVSAFNRALAMIHDRNVHVNTYYRNYYAPGYEHGPGGTRHATGGYIGFAEGGFVDRMRQAADAFVRRFPTGGHVSGPGTGTSDSIPAYLSNGEYVVNAARTRQYRRELDAINYGPARPAMPSGAAAGGGTVINIALRVEGSVISERNLVETVRRGLAGRAVLMPGRNGTAIPRTV